MVPLVSFRSVTGLLLVAASKKLKKTNILRGPLEPRALDLAAYAKEHRYRLRNVHDGHPVPPARAPRGSDGPTGYIGVTERMDAIVGSKGYITMDGDKLSMCLFDKNALGINRALPRLEAIDARIYQVGDTELGATVSVEHIGEVLSLIRVSTVPLRNPGGNPAWRKSPIPEPALSPESPESAPCV